MFSKDLYCRQVKSHDLFGKRLNSLFLTIVKTKNCFVGCEVAYYEFVILTKMHQYHMGTESVQDLTAHYNLTLISHLLLRYPDPEDRSFLLHHVISVSISIELRETTLTISVLTGEPVSMESEIVRVVSLITTEISETTPLKIQSSGTGYLKRNYILFMPTEACSSERVKKQLMTDRKTLFPHCNRW